MDKPAQITKGLRKSFQSTEYKMAAVINKKSL